MPIYEITDPKTSKVLEFEGPTQPDQRTIMEAFSRASFEVSKQAQPEADTVPQWGRENPNAYGVAGAIKETALTAGRAVKNLPGDVWRLGGEVVNLLTTQTPVDVAMSLGKTATGGVGKLIPGEQPYEQDFDALANIYKTKYGSLDNLKKTIEEKPAEFLADITTAMGGTGMALRGAGKVTGVKSLETAGKATTEAGVKIGMAPIKAAEKGVKGVQSVGGKAINKVLPAPEGLYESAAKWSTTLKPEVRQKITQTMLKEDIGLNPAGYEKLTSTVDDLNEQIKAQIKPFARKPIDATQVNRWTREARTKAAKTLERDKNLAQIDEVVNDFNKTWGEGKLTVGKAQAIKQDIYKELKSHYDAKSKGGSKYTDAEVAAKKNIARGLKESIEKATGGKVRDLNARESSLLNAEPHLRRAVGRTGNHNILSLDDVLAATAGGVVGGPLGAAAFGVARKALGSPSMKARLAIEIYKRQQKGVKSAEMSALSGKEQAILKSNIPDTDKERFLTKIYGEGKK